MDKQPIKRELDENNKETPKKSGKIEKKRTEADNRHTFRH